MGSSMNAYLLESLHPTGWRRSSELHWRFADASDAASRMLADATARAVRVLPVVIRADAILTLERTPAADDRQGVNHG